MQPLNPFLAAFFKPGNPIHSQCTPVHHHILLVPTTEFLLTSRETESGQTSADLIASEEFLGSHVLRIPSPATAAAGGKDAVGNLREVRGKARQYSTLNGRSVVIKDAIIFSNKGVLLSPLSPPLSLLSRNLTCRALCRVVPSRLQDLGPGPVTDRFHLVWRYHRT